MPVYFKRKIKSQWSQKKRCIILLHVTVFLLIIDIVVKCSSGKIKTEEVLSFIMSMYYFRKMKRVRGIYFQ